MLLKGKKGGQVGAPKRKLKNLLLRTRKLENLADENEIELESKENIKKWSSKSNPSKLAWLLRLKKGNQAGLSQAGGWGGFSPFSFWPNSSSYLNQGQGGGRLCPPCAVLRAPRIFRSCDGPVKTHKKKIEKHA